jgi:hypothetical protein
MTVLAVRLKSTHPQKEKARYRRGGLVFTIAAETLVDTDEVDEEAVQAIRDDDLLVIRETDYEADSPPPAPAAEPLFCLIEDCRAAGGDFAGFESEASLATHARTEHGMEAWKQLESDEIVFREDVAPVDLGAMKRDELDAYAEKLGVEHPGRFDNKGEVIAAIQALPSIEEENTQLKARVAELEGELETLTANKALEGNEGKND